MPASSLHRLAAFTTVPTGGNPAGVWVGDALPSAAEMQRIAADVGFSETAFVAPTTGADRTVRYYSPEAEVSFCGHATIATAVALAERDGPGRVELRAAPGPLALDTRADGHGRIVAGMLTVPPASYEVDPADVDAALAALGWTRDELDSRLPPRVAFAGARHLVLAVRRRERLADLEYDYEALARIGRHLDLIIVALIWREDESRLHARNLGPSVGIVEDPATGAAAAALGGYLAELGEVTPPAHLTIFQGEAMGRPSRLEVDLDPSRAGVLVSGSAVPIDD